MRPAPSARLPAAAARCRPPPGVCRGRARTSATAAAGSRAPPPQQLQPAAAAARRGVVSSRPRRGAASASSAWGHQFDEEDNALLRERLDSWIRDHPKAARGLALALDRANPDQIVSVLNLFAAPGDERTWMDRWALPRKISPDDIAARAERRAENGQGKTCFFAYLGERDKVQVLRIATAATDQEMPAFCGKVSEGKTAFFARLPEDVKLKALREWAQGRDDRAKKRESEAEGGAVTAPTGRQLRLLGLRVALPMVGFGFVDNFCMIAFGDAIEAHFGLVLGLSTMAAAGLGNMCSDIAGLGIADTIEHSAGMLGIKDPLITPQQRKLPIVRTVNTAAAVLGLAIGCLLGMVPLLFIDRRDRGDSNEGAAPVAAAA
eukprot:TRINITY_DN17093_c0_g1_i1.p1 TRINITY_DN17093_c0_g1~~TRINITY_DN17093_c0_g1_i1.p1  ORF type:complete len:377 (+),score=111.64 TRINITY_DN17093_c0_g1_i1:73-1203(+)